jgi:hypothetical protein
MSETKAFWSFYHLMKGSKHYIRGDFFEWFSHLSKVNLVWEWFLKKWYPKIAQNLEKHQIKPMHYTPTWFLSGFMSLPFRPVLKLRLFDRYVAFGTRSMLSFAFTIIALEKELFATGTTDRILNAFQTPFD